MIWIYLLSYAILAAAIVKSIGFWVYLWQIKDYRFDRFCSEFCEKGKIFRFWFFGGGKTFRRPKWTGKAVIITGLALSGFLAVLIMPTRLILPDTISTEDAGLINLLVFYFLVPVAVTLLVVIMKVPTAILKNIIYYRASKKMKNFKNLLVIGITGSYGKSSTKEFVAQILANKYKVAKTPDNINSEIGVANWILKNFPNDAEIAVIEMGAYRIGEIKKTCDIVRPCIGILTGINEQHQALFGSLENIKKAKFELIENLLQLQDRVVLRNQAVEPVAIFNGEDAGVLEIAQKYQGKGIIYRSPEIAPKRAFPRHYLINLEAAIRVARYCGMEEWEIEEAIKKIQFTDRMIHEKTTAQGMKVIDDTYSANPDGVLAGLDHLGNEDKKNKVVIMPCLIELGDAASEVHGKIGRKIFETCDFGIITTPDNFEDIKQEAGDKVILESDPQKVISAFEKFLDKKMHRDTAVLLEGRLSSSVIKYFEDRE